MKQNSQFLCTACRQPPHTDPDISININLGPGSQVWKVSDHFSLKKMCKTAAENHAVIGHSTFYVPASFYEKEEIEYWELEQEPGDAIIMTPGFVHSVIVQVKLILSFSLFHKVVICCFLFFLVRVSYLSFSWCTSTCGLGSCHGS